MQFQEESVRGLDVARKLEARISTVHTLVISYSTSKTGFVQQFADANSMRPDLLFSHGAFLTDSAWMRCSFPGLVLVRYQTRNRRWAWDTPLHGKRLIVAVGNFLGLILLQFSVMIPWPKWGWRFRHNEILTTIVQLMDKFAGNCRCTMYGNLGRNKGYADGVVDWFHCSW